MITPIDATWIVGTDRQHFPKTDTFRVTYNRRVKLWTCRIFSLDITDSRERTLVT